MHRYSRDLKLLLIEAFAYRLLTGELVSHRETDSGSARHCWLIFRRWPNTDGLLGRK